MSWNRMSKVIDRYERLTYSQIKDLKILQKQALDKSSRDNSSVRRQIQQLEDHLLNGLNQLLTMRNELEMCHHDDFDHRIEPIRSQIQTAVAVNKSLPLLQQSKNFFDEDNTAAAEMENPYEFESKRYAQQTLAGIREMEQKVQDAKEKAEATAKLQRDMHDLEEIFTELATLVHQQHDMVDSIEEHVERAHHDVQRGNTQLKKAVQHKTAKAPLFAAVAGGLVVGGPVGLAAGSTLAGITAAVGGVVAGLYGGKWFKKSVNEDT